MSSPITEETILNALRTVKDPDLHKDIVTLGMIRDLKLCGGVASFRFVLTTPACPVRDQLKDQAYRAVMTIPGMEQVDIKMDAEVPKARGAVDKAAIEGIRHIIAVSSGKGGVGKSTVAVNLAVALAQMGARVGILDTDVYGPNVPIMMGGNDAPAVRGETMIPPVYHGVKTMSIGLLNPGDRAIVWRGPMLHSFVSQFLRQVAWGELDYLIVDMPPGCLTADTQVFTSKGPLPVSKIEEGMEVYSFDGQFNKASHKSPWEMQASLVKRKVLAVFSQGKAEVFELKTPTRSIKGTGNHPLLVVNRSRRGDSRFYDYTFEWKKLGEIKPGDVILTVKRLPEEASAPLTLPELTAQSKFPLTIPAYSSDDFMRLVGYFIGDGFVRKTNGKYWGVWFSEPVGGKYRAKYVNLLKELFGFPHIHQQEQKFAAISAPFAELFEKLELNHSALEKTVPDWVFTLPDSQKLAFIEGYCDADGHRRVATPGHRRPGWMAFESPNQALLEAMRTLCIYAGLKVGNLNNRTRDIRVPSTQQVLTRTFWNFEANHTAKTDIYGAGLIRGPIVGNGLRNDYIGFERVREVKPLGVEEVYDLHVEGEHNFVANGFIVHNTGDVQLSMAQLVSLAGAILVTTPQEVSLGDVRKAYNMFEQLKVPCLGIVENMSHFVCPNCDERHYIFGHGGGEALAERYDVPFLGAIPLSVNVREGGDLGVPIVVGAPDSLQAKAFRAVAQNVAAQISIAALQTNRTLPVLNLKR